MGLSASKETPNLSPPQSLRSLLCNQDWYLDRDHRSFITFQHDGTGKVNFLHSEKKKKLIAHQLACGSENSLCIAAEFQWEVGSALDTTLHLGNSSVLGQMDMQIALTKRC